MSWNDLDLSEFEEDKPGPDDDPSVQELEPLLIELFNSQPEAVFYESQLCVHFEARFFYWVTARALKDLREGGRIASELQELSPKVPIRFYFSKRNRYWKRRAAEIRKLVLSFSEQAFTNALGAASRQRSHFGWKELGNH